MKTRYALWPVLNSATWLHADACRPLSAFGKAGSLLLGVLLLLLPSPRLTLAATVSWVGGNGDWDSATNWSTGSLPELGDDVVIDVPGSITVTHSLGNHSAKSVVCQEAFILSGGAL